MHSREHTGSGIATASPSSYSRILLFAALFSAAKACIAHGSKDGAGGATGTLSDAQRPLGLHLCTLVLGATGVATRGAASRGCRYAS
mmetsp:Transcript_37694/g.85034  ORF Transcript_37694/g.85034 Transcript_37694/m.85034 type:complete len:87 (+) Transcript_37694:283-543(+)